MRPRRYTLDQTMTKVDVAADDNIAMRSLLIVAQADGVIAFGESADTDCTDAEDVGWGLIDLTAGEGVPIHGISGREDVFIATPTGTLEVHVFETGVA